MKHKEHLYVVNDGFTAYWVFTLFLFDRWCKISRTTRRSIWQVDRTVTMSQYGYVVAADATAQMIFSPLFGLLADR
jgi:MFS family permease